MTMINTMLNRPEVEVELPDRVLLLTTNTRCPSIWVKDRTHPAKVLLKRKLDNQKRFEHMITLTRTIDLNLKRILLLTLETKDKYDLRGVNDPDESMIRMNSRKMCSVLTVKVKVRKDERMRCPHPPRRFKWNQKNNKEKERKFLNSMLFQKYLTP
jgi:hypothetical protein